MQQAEGAGEADDEAAPRHDKTAGRLRRRGDKPPAYSVVVISGDDGSLDEQRAALKAYSDSQPTDCDAAAAAQLQPASPKTSPPASVFFALPADQQCTPGSTTALGSAALGVIVIGCRSRYRLELQKAEGSVGIAPELALVLERVNLSHVHVRKCARGAGVATALGRAVVCCMLDSASLVVERAACLVAGAETFWLGCGMRVIGVPDDHPRPTRGAIVPRTAVASVLTCQPARGTWMCGNCGQSTQVSCIYCSNAACGKRRPEHPRLLTDPRRLVLRG